MAQTRTPDIIQWDTQRDDQGDSEGGQGKSDNSAKPEKLEKEPLPYFGPPAFDSRKGK